MSFGISGFGALQVTAYPTVFQALSLSGAPPRAPQPPYGTPNQNLVPVASSGNPAVPANLTLAAHPTFEAILKVTGQTSVLAVGHPAIQTLPFTTTSIAATNPRVQAQGQGPAPAGVPIVGNPPAGPVSFSLTAAPASLTSGIDALHGTLGELGPPGADPRGAPGASQASIPAPASAPAVARIAQTVQTLAVSAIYSAPVFSFSA